MNIGDKCNPIIGYVFMDGRILIGENTKIQATPLTIYDIVDRTVYTRDPVDTEYVFTEVNVNSTLMLSNLRVTEQCLTRTSNGIII